MFSYHDGGKIHKCVILCKYITTRVAPIFQVSGMYFATVGLMKKMDKATKAVLIIENDRDLAESIRLYLEDSYRVYITKDPSKVHDFITRHKVQLVLTDIDIPSSALQEQLSCIKSANPDIKIIVMYMFLDEEELMEQLLFQTADDYIFKPFDADVLKQKLDRLLTVKPTGMVHN